MILLENQLNEDTRIYTMFEGQFVAMADFSTIT